MTTKEQSPWQQRSQDSGENVTIIKRDLNHHMARGCDWQVWNPSMMLVSYNYRHSNSVWQMDKLTVLCAWQIWFYVTSIFLLSFYVKSNLFYCQYFIGCFFIYRLESCDLYHFNFRYGNNCQPVIESVILVTLQTCTWDNKQKHNPP